MPRLLIVDDEPEIGSFIGRVASTMGFDIMSVSTSDQFLNHVRAWWPTHIMMDLRMPNFDGLTLLSDLAAEKCTANIILMSGVDRSVVEAARRVGLDRGLKIDEAMTKPIRVPDLKAALDAAGREEPWLTIASLSSALDRRELCLHYQPKVDLVSDEIAGLEALMRWNHPTRGLIMPSDFIPLAESSALIDRLAIFLAEESLGQLARWAADGLELGLALNISARNLHDVRLVEMLEAQCRAFNIDPERVTIELTETAAMKDAVQMMDLLARLRIKGFKLSIDDFGTGYSSLVQLHRLPFCEIKIDRAFVVDCATSPESRSIVKTVINLAHDLGMTAVAEGVETAEGLAILRELKCDQVQGFFIARPALPADLDLKPASATAEVRPTAG